MQESGTGSVREFARKTGEDWSVVSRHLRLLRLPDEIIAFLENHETPDVLRHFTVKRLDEPARLNDDEASGLFQQQLAQIGVGP